MSGAEQKGGAVALLSVRSTIHEKRHNGTNGTAVPGNGNDGNGDRDEGHVMDYDDDDDANSFDCEGEGDGCKDIDGVGSDSFASDSASENDSDDGDALGRVHLERGAFRARTHNWRGYSYFGVALPHYF